MDRSLNGTRDVSSETCAGGDTARDDATSEQVESAPSTTVFVVDEPDTADEGPRLSTGAIYELDSAALDPGTEADAIFPVGGSGEAGEGATALQLLVADRADSSSNYPTSNDDRSSGTLSIVTEDCGTSPQSETTTRSVSPRTAGGVSVRSSPSHQKELREQELGLGAIVLHLTNIAAFEVTSCYTYHTPHCLAACCAHVAADNPYHPQHVLPHVAATVTFTSDRINAVKVHRWRGNGLAGPFSAHHSNRGRHLSCCSCSCCCCSCSCCPERGRDLC